MSCRLQLKLEADEGNMIHEHLGRLAYEKTARKKKTMEINTFP